MATTPTRLQIGTSYDQAVPLLNQNFDNVVQDIRDLGANNSTTLRVPLLAVAASSLTSLVVTLTSQGVVSSSAHQVFTTKPVAAISGISPSLDIYVDTDADANYLFYYGASLSAAQKLLFPIVTPLNTGFEDSLGAWLIQINNRDASPHDYYLYTQCGYFPTQATGIFR